MSPPLFAGNTPTSLKRFSRITILLLAGILNIGWSSQTIRQVTWTSVDFLPSDLATEVREHHRRFDAGINRGMNAPPDWLEGPPGHLEEALIQIAHSCRTDLRKPIPLGDLVEELGILSVLALRANDPLAVSHADRRERLYRQAYSAYTFSILDRVRLVYYGPGGTSIGNSGYPEMVARSAMRRSREFYPFVGEEFYRGGALRNWREFDDRSIAFGVAAISLSHGMTDFINLCRWVWKQGGGQVVPPRPTPVGHKGPVIIPAPRLKKGFEKIKKTRKGAPALPEKGLKLPPP